jgi:uncharacterized protein (TIGR00251 family)
LNRSDPDEGAVWTEVDRGVLVRVRVQPRSSRPGVAGRHGQALKVRVSAPPVEGAANDELIEILAEWLCVPRRSIAIAQGRAGRDKVLKVTVGSPATFGARLDGLLGELIDKPRGGG